MGTVEGIHPEKMPLQWIEEINGDIDVFLLKPQVQELARLES